MAGLAIGVLLAAAAAIPLLSGGSSGPAPAREFTLVVPGKGSIDLPRPRARAIASGRLPLPVPATRLASRGSARITYRLDRDAARRGLKGALRSGDGSVVVGERPVASLIRAPVVKQVYRNNCETAALSMLLASRGVDVGQQALQRQLRRDGPLDPRTAPDGSKVWGDPRYGFVGRVEGGGLAGGFGVYPKPLIALAKRWVPAVNLTGAPPDRIYRRLLAGHAVLAWAGLAAGPYESWRGPRGERVTVNWGEHTVLLRGLEGDRVLVNDPLTGRRLTWTKQEFESSWALLGDRAISA